MAEKTYLWNRLQRNGYKVKVFKQAILNQREHGQLSSNRHQTSHHLEASEEHQTRLQVNSPGIPSIKRQNWSQAQTPSSPSNGGKFIH